MRPKLAIDWKILDELCKYSATAEMCANILKVSKDTLERRIKQEQGLTFTQYRAQRMDHTKTKLIRKAIEKALGGDNTMLIFCLKNLCGWSDKREEKLSIDEAKGLVINFARDKKENK